VLQHSLFLYLTISISALHSLYHPIILFPPTISPIPIHTFYDPTSFISHLLIMSFLFLILLFPFPLLSLSFPFLSLTYVYYFYSILLIFPIPHIFFLFPISYNMIIHYSLILIFLFYFGSLLLFCSIILTLHNITFPSIPYIFPFLIYFFNSLISSPMPFPPI
jgi:hypothetical protein